MSIETKTDPTVTPNTARAHARTWTVNLLGTVEDYHSGDVTGVSVTIDESAVPTTTREDGVEVPDHGSADWPTDDEVAAELSRLLGVPFRVGSPDAGDDQLETIYKVEPDLRDTEGRPLSVGDRVRDAISASGGEIVGIYCRPLDPRAHGRVQAHVRWSGGLTGTGGGWTSIDLVHDE